MTKEPAKTEFPPDNPITDENCDSPTISTRGRPSEFHSDYNDMVINFMAKGHSLTAFAYRIRVAPNTVKAWIKQFPEFADAVEIGRAGRVKRTEDTLNKEGKALTAPMAATGWKILTNIAPDEYRDKVTIDTGNGDTSQKALEELRDSFQQIANHVGGRLLANQQLVAASVIDVESDIVPPTDDSGIIPHADIPHTDESE